MDFDTYSQCSGLSNPSDELKSNVSTLSGLSTYQDEFVELRHLLNPLKYPSPTVERCSTPKQDTSCDLPYNDRVSDLSNQLVNSLKLNEKYKNDLYNLEKNIELKYYDKIDVLLKSNRRLQLELASANTQINRLISNFSTKHESSLVSQKNYILLEQLYHELSLQNSTLQFNLVESRNQNEENELENKQLKIDLNELKIDFEAKRVSVNKLKEKISQQHLEIDSLLKNNVASTQSLKEFSSELEHVKKVQEWYKEQLHLCQRDRRVFLDENLKYKTELSLRNETINMLNLELAKCRNKCDMVQIESLKEKGKLQKQLENGNLRISQNQMESDSVRNHLNCSVENSDVSIINYYEASIADLNNEMIKIKEYVQEQDTTIKKTAKENSELIARCVVLQKMIQQNEMSIEELENSKKHSNVELILANDKIKENNEELTFHKAELLKLNAELKVRKEEKELTEITINKVREQFFAFKSKYKKIEEELLQKNKQILQLEAEKQKLFMDNNWNICELEKNKEKEAIINDLKNVLDSCRQTSGEHLASIKRLEDDLQDRVALIKKLEEEKRTIVNDNLIEIHKYEGVFEQYKIMVTNSEKQINEVKKLLSESEFNLINYKDDIQLLKDELTKRDSELDVMTTKCTMLENTLTDYEKTNNIKPSEDLEWYMKKIISKNHFNLTEVLQHFMKVCKIDNTNQNDDSKIKAIEDFSNMSKRIEKYIHNLDNTNIDEQNQENQNILEIDAFKLKNEVDTKLTKLNDGINILYNKTENCYKMLNSLLNLKKINKNEDLKELNVLLQVKERELKEKQKKYEKNYRTLLRKVKEHMKGRNAAEKHNKYLQELYNSLCDDNNSLKLAFSSKDYEIENFVKQSERYMSINEKLNQKILNLEEEVVKYKTCERCLEYTAAVEKIEILEKCVEELQHEKDYVRNILRNKEDIISSLHQERQEMFLKNTNLASEKKNCQSRLDDIESEKECLMKKISSLETELRTTQNLIGDLKHNLNEENRRYLDSNNENVTLKIQINQLHDKIECLSQDIEILDSTLQAKSEEFLQLEDKKSKIDCNWVKKEENSQKTIKALKNYLHEMQIDINTLNSDKYFLQRLCNDLKLALRTYVSHNKVLKEQLNILSKDKQEFNSLPNVLLDVPSTSKYDDTYINQLLQQNRAPTKDKPLVEIRGCLDNLRKEISVLQEEIVKKNIGR